MTAKGPDAVRAKPTVRGLDRGLRMLTLFSEGRPEWRINDVSRELDLPLSTTYRLVNTLIAEGFLERHRSHGKIRLGLTLIRLGRLAQSNLSLTEVADREMHWLATETGETAVLMVPRKSHVVCVANVEGTYPIRPRSVGVGEHLPYNGGAVPLAILAFLPAAERERILDGGLHALTHKTLHSREALTTRCAEIRTEGYAYSHEEAIEGTAAVAAPVFGADGAVAGAIGVTGLTERIAGVEAEVVHSARRISARLGSEVAGSEVAGSEVAGGGVTGSG